MKDALLRAHAEQENIRKRAEQDVRNAKQYGIKSLAESLLEVADNLTRAIESVKPENRSTELTNLLEGVQMTERLILKAFHVHGIKKFEPVPGEHPFDPKVHNALFNVPDPNIKPGHVAAVHAPGYTIHDRILRPAQVGVSAGPPSVSKEQEEADPKES